MLATFYILAYNLFLSRTFWNDVVRFHGRFEIKLLQIRGNNEVPRCRGRCNENAWLPEAPMFTRLSPLNTPNNLNIH
jgi:hypothetical protein